MARFVSLAVSIERRAPSTPNLSYAERSLLRGKIVALAGLPGLGCGPSRGPRSHQQPMTGD